MEIYNWLLQVLAASTHLQVTEAVDLCCEFIKKAITVDNCTDILNLAEHYSLTSSKETARKFILDHFEIFSQSEEFGKLTNVQLGSMLAENSLKVMSEYKLFELVLYWIEQDQENRQQHVAELMEQIRLPLLSGEELVEKVSKVSHLLY